MQPMQVTFTVLDSARPWRHDLLFLKTPAASLKIIEIDDLKKADYTAIILSLPCNYIKNNPRVNTKGLTKTNCSRKLSAFDCSVKLNKVESKWC